MHQNETKIETKYPTLSSIITYSMCVFDIYISSLVLNKVPHYVQTAFSCCQMQGNFLMERRQYVSSELREIHNTNDFT